MKFNYFHKSKISFHKTVESVYGEIRTVCEKKRLDLFNYNSLQLVRTPSLIFFLLLLQFLM